MKKIWMVAAATNLVFFVNAQDSEIETQAIGVVIDAHALVDVEWTVVYGKCVL